MNYEAAGYGRRKVSGRPNALDADGAASRRARLANITRDMVRNTPYAARAKSVICNNVVGDGIIPSIEGVQPGVKKRFLELVQAHCDTTDIDVHGRGNLYSLQWLAMAAVVESGECLVRIIRRPGRSGLALPFQLRVMEPDYLDGARDTVYRPGEAQVIEGIEYDASGRRVAYWLFDEHPGSLNRFRSVKSERVPASEIIHIYRQDRPEQMRGVSWLAPVALSLQDCADFQDAALMRQKIAACFAAFRITDGTGAKPIDGVSSEVPATLEPGAIMELAPGEDVKFGTPPAVDGYDSFTRSVLRACAAGLGITYEALVGDLSDVNFSSGRMGRIEMNSNVSRWQHTMLIPQMMEPLGKLILESWLAVDPGRRIDRARVCWTPPAKPIVDPNKEVPAMVEAIRGGLVSWQEAIRSLGKDPETVRAEFAEDNRLADEMKLTLDSDARVAAKAKAPANGTPDGAPQP